MKWFRKWMLDSLRKASVEESQQHNTECEDTLSSSLAYSPVNKVLGKNIRHSPGLYRGNNGHDIELPDGGLNIQVKSAIGGKIIIFRTYDERTDRNSYSTYLIPDGENFQESLGKIVTMESLKL
jgi:hypothetical protein